MITPNDPGSPPAVPDRHAGPYAPAVGRRVAEPSGSGAQARPQVRPPVIWPRIVWISAALGLTAVLLWGRGSAGSGDLMIYRAYGAAMARGAVPYRDVAMEYPPGSVALIWLAHLIGAAGPGFAIGFTLLSAAAVGTVLWQETRAWAGSLVLAVALLLPVLPLAFFRLDLAAGAALSASLWSAARGRAAWAGVLAATAVLVKAYPAVAVPVLLAMLGPPCRRRFLAAFAGGLAAGILPFAVLAPHGLAASVRYHAGRPVQLESVWALPGLVPHLAGRPLQAIWSHTSWSVVYPGAGIAGRLSVAAVVAVPAALALAMRPGLGRRPATAVLAVLLGFAAAFKIGSPQLLVPAVLVGFAAARELAGSHAGGLRLRLAGLGVVLLAELQTYASLITPRWPAVLVLLLRWAIVVELTLWLVRRVRAAAHPSRAWASSPGPAS